MRAGDQNERMLARALVSLRRCSIGLSGLLCACTGGLGSSSPVAPPSDAGETLRIDRIEVRSSFYNPRDAFHQTFEAAVRPALNGCATGDRPVTLRAWIHDLDRSGSLLGEDGRVRLPGAVELVEHGRVIARARIAVDVPAPEGGLPAHRAAASRAFGTAVCHDLLRR